jgi:hypothetical protein
MRAVTPALTTSGIVQRRTPNSTEKAPQASAKAHSPNTQFDVVAARARQPLGDQPHGPGGDPHQAGGEVGQRPVVIRVTVPVEGPVEGAGAQHRFG